MTGLSGIVPQGGNVQFVVVSGGSEFPISPSAALFTVGSLSVAQVAVQTGAVSGLDTVGPVQLKAVYSGGINAFGSESRVADFNILEPIKDGCDSVDEDPGTVEVDDTCDFSTPKNLGGGTVLNSLSIAGGTLDGALNAVVVHPGQSVTVSGTVGRTEYCPGCLRQLYLGIAGYDPQPSSLSPRPAERIGPACVYSGGLPLTPAGQNYGATFNAPMTPGVYYLRAGTTLDYFCVGPPMAPPDKSVGRIVVTADVTAAVEVHRKDGDTNPWNDALDNTTTMGTTSAGDQVTLLARVPAGATGRVRFHWGNTTVLAPVCPPSAKVPEGTDRGFDCTPGQARALSPIVDETALQVAVSGRYVDPAPTRLIDPQNGASKAYPLYEAPCQPTSDPCSNTVSLKVLLTPSVTLTASPGLPG
ncbi:MAG: hypothetical protein IPF51_06135, partial [Dehalococcoidia bacterium]|uniref:hypothetical protein n=1 Tax=Candidatus Amarobacter glycogenicus TaxID=3140699 RepID=UPI0031346B2C|nr:hypothetical protein [Dehalococcoidia bacterium]